jgi:hypothetical protein
LLDNTGSLINILKNDKPKNIYQLFLDLNKSGIGQSGEVKYFNSFNNKELIINDLKKNFVLYGFFKDNNGNWKYDVSGLEQIGQSANIASFIANYYDIGYQTSKETIALTSLKSSPYVEKIIGEKSIEQNFYQVTISRILWGDKQKKEYSDRSKRQEIPPIYSSYLKLNFKDQDKGKLKFDIVFDELWDNTQKSLFKLEVLPDYSEDHNKLFDLFRANKISELHNEWLLLFGKEKFSFKWRRVHIVDLPLTEYLRFEIECYKVWSELGVEVYFQTFENIKHVCYKPIFEDFLIFDEKQVIVNEFNNYDYVGSKITSNPRIVSEYLRFQKCLEKNIVPMAKFLSA